MQDITNVANTSYVGTVSLGTPPQTFQLAFDTGSADTWVASTKCDGSCDAKNKFDASKSSTYVYNGTEFTIGYLAGTVHGVMARDTLRIAGVEIKDQLFGELVNGTDLADSFTNSQFDGVMGFAFSNLSATNTPTVFDNMVAEGLVDSPVFSFYLSSDPSKPGQLTLGGTDPSRYVGDVVYVDVTKPQTWSIKLDAFNVNGVNYVPLDAPANSFTTVHIDSGSAALFLPSRILTELMSQLGATQQESSGQYAVECIRLPLLYGFDFILGGNTYTLTPWDYTLDDNDTCLLSVLPISREGDDESAAWVLGDVFMRKCSCASTTPCSMWAGSDWDSRRPSMTDLTGCLKCPRQFILILVDACVESLKLLEHACEIALSYFNVKIPFVFFSIYENSSRPFFGVVPSKVF